MVLRTDVPATTLYVKKHRHRSLTERSFKHGRIKWRGCCGGFKPQDGGLLALEEGAHGAERHCKVSSGAWASATCTWGAMQHVSVLTHVLACITPCACHLRCLLPCRAAALAKEDRRAFQVESRQVATLAGRVAEVAEAENRELVIDVSGHAHAARC